MMDRDPRARPSTAWRRLAADTAKAVRFYSRLPVPALPFEADPHGVPDVNSMPAVVPLAALVIAVSPALLIAAALGLQLGPWLSAALGVAALTLVTGAFHEDGLADTADGFGGGATAERRLVIMRDSRIGSFGGAALVLAFSLRIAALATVAERLPASGTALVVLIVAALSRTAGLVPLTLLPPARFDGAAYAVGQPARETLWIAAALSSALTLALGLLARLPLSGLILMLLLSGLSGYVLMRLSRRLIGGATGDVAGAAQQIAEISALVALLVTLPP
jgi:adenosylcobinamide-GDP ribazoletransferase